MQAISVVIGCVVKEQKKVLSGKRLFTFSPRVISGIQRLQEACGKKIVLV